MTTAKRILSNPIRFWYRGWLMTLNSRRRSVLLNVQRWHNYRPSRSLLGRKPNLNRKYRESCIKICHRRAGCKFLIIEREYVKQGHRMLSCMKCIIEKARRVDNRIGHCKRRKIRWKRCNLESTFSIQIKELRRKHHR